MTFHRKPLTIAVALAALFFSAPASAQEPEGKINGVVRDTTGAGIPAVTVTATIAVAPGAYSLTTSIPGFRKGTQAVTVAGGASSQTDFSLEIALSEGVTVTAMKREETIFNVPFSLAAPTEQTLRARGVEDLEGVAANVGGFTVQNLGPGQSQVALRGVSAGQIVRDQPGVKEQVGVYLDESVISLSLFTPDVDLFDTNRVEVLRGPQGTLFGSGSLSGTVRYIRSAWTAGTGSTTSTSSPIRSPPRGLRWNSGADGSSRS